MPKIEHVEIKATQNGKFLVTVRFLPIFLYSRENEKEVERIIQSGPGDFVRCDDLGILEPFQGLSPRIYAENDMEAVCVRLKGIPMVSTGDEAVA